MADGWDLSLISSPPVLALDEPRAVLEGQTAAFLEMRVEGGPPLLRVSVMGVTAGELQGGSSQSGLEKQTII